MPWADEEQSRLDAKGPAAAAGQAGPTAKTSPAADSPEQRDSPVLRFARQLARGVPFGREFRRDGSDAYRFKVGEDGAIDVESGSQRGVLYAVYDVLAGKTSGDEKPAFAIRGLFPCDATQRHTREMYAG